MATGDQDDFTSRLFGLLPIGWFPVGAPRVSAVLQGAAAAFSRAYALITFVRDQTRIETASGVFLDLISQSFFADEVARLQYESDSAFAARIKYNLTAPRGTRDGMSDMLLQLTGRAPIIFQPNRAADCICLASLANIESAGAGSVMRSASSYSAPYGSFGNPSYGNDRPAWGTLEMPCQVFIVVTPPVSGYGIYSGYDGFGSIALPNAGGGGGLGSVTDPDAVGQGIALVFPDSLPDVVSDSVIYEHVRRWMPVGYTAWVLVTNQENL